MLAVWIAQTLAQSVKDAQRWADLSQVEDLRAYLIHSIDCGLTLAPAAAVCASAAGGFVPVFGKAGVFVPTPSQQIVAVPAGGNFTRFGKLGVRARCGGGAFRIEILRGNWRELTNNGIPFCTP
jgi:hypothetical protein